MQTSHNRQNSAGIHGLYHQPVQDIDPFCSSNFQIMENNVSPDIGSQGTNFSIQGYDGQYFTLDSAPAVSSFGSYDSPSAVSVASNRSPFSTQGSHSYVSDAQHSSDYLYGSPISGSSVANGGPQMWDKLREIENSLFGPESDISDSCNCCLNSGSHQFPSTGQWNVNQMIEMIPKLDLKDVLIVCAQAVAEADMPKTAALMEVLERMVSVSGDPIQRLGAYLLEGLRARLESSGSIIYRKLKCKEPTGSELMSYMSILYQICPYWKFAYESANVVIGEAIKYESRIHIIDFQIAQGSQWIPIIQGLAGRTGGPPLIRITGVDDSQSAHARGGGLDIVGKRLEKVAELCGVPFEFHAAAMCGSQVEREDLRVRPGEAIAVNFPFVLHHMPDESVSTHNHRDRLLRLVKSLSPKVVTLVEQESKTNTSPFYPRFIETLDYYTAMFESIDVACRRDDKQRISAEQHCVARDIVNMIACEETERVERHELLGKWRSRFRMAGFQQFPLSSAVTDAVRNLLREYNENYRIEEKDGALYLWWRNRAMATSSAWW